MGRANPNDQLILGVRRRKAPPRTHSMTAAFKLFCNLITRAVCIALGVLTGAIVVITMAAVWWRYVINDPISWSEQICRILFVWMTFLGAAVLYRQKLHFTIDMVVMLIPDPLRTLLYWLAEIGVLVFAVIFFIFGLKLSLDTWTNTFGALDITPASFYLSAPASSALIVIYFIEKLIDPTKRRPTGAAQVD
jgi:TRAP-type C4-dicarboxylate transport system permease small subunit